jgi:transposase
MQRSAEDVKVYTTPVDVPFVCPIGWDHAIERIEAGIDIGAEEIYVAVPQDRDEESTRRFSSFTGDLHALADWLSRCRIQSVAMESTGVYWIPLFQILEKRGFKVYLVNALSSAERSGRSSNDLVQPIFVM